MSCPLHAIAAAEGNKVEAKEKKKKLEESDDDVGIGPLHYKSFFVVCSVKS